MDAAVFSPLLSEAISKPGVISEAYSAFHNYSIGNQLHALFQCMARGIPPGPIATFPAWKQRGRHVRKGEKALTLCMPITCKRKRVNPQNNQQEEYAFTWFVFRAQWFVLAQTEGADYAGEVRSPVWEAAKALPALGIKQENFQHTDGNCQGYAVDRRIAVSPIAKHPHKTRFHEIAHVVLGHTTESAMTDFEHTPRNIREVEAEAVAYILCSLLGLPGQEESRGYIQHWLSGEEITERSAQRIFTAADKVLKAGEPEVARAANGSQ